MGSRNKEICVAVLDTGPHMADVLKPAAKALCTFIQGKMIHKASHEVQLVFFGTEGTRNVLNMEMAEQGDDSQYANIMEERPMGQPDIAWLKSLQHVEAARPGTPADFFDALTLAVDALYRTLDERPELQKKSSKRIVLVSNFLGEAKPVDQEFMENMVGKLREEDILLDILSIDIPGADAAAADMKNANADILAQLLQEVRHKQRSVPDAVELSTAFKTKETAPFTYYSGTLSIGSQMNIGVKVLKKVAPERLPAVGKYSDRSSAAGAAHTVTRDTEYRLASNPDEVVPKEELVKAYQYGSETVPMAAEIENALKFHAPKGMQLLGFLVNDPSLPAGPPIPRHHFMKDVWLAAPDKADQRSCLAMAALVAAMLRVEHQVALVRFVPRADSQPQLCVATPMPQALDRPACLLLNILPFQEDIRQFPFQSFDRSQGQKHVPTKKQMRTAESLIKAMGLSKGEHVPLQPENTANPLLHRFYDLLAAKAMDAEAPLPDAGPAAERLRSPPGDYLSPEAPELLQSLSDVFVIKPRAQAKAEGDGTQPAEGLLGRAGGGTFTFSLEEDPGSVVEAVGSAVPVDDFKALRKAGRANLAFDGMQSVIKDIVRRSIGERLYGKALQALEALREASAEERARAPAFNTYLNDLADTFEHDATHAGFWRKVMAAKVTLISEEEAPGSGASATDASRFLSQHAPENEAMTEPTQKIQEEEEDDFADMD